VNSDLNENELELKIIKCKNLKSGADSNVYIFVAFPIPSAEAPQKCQTPTANGSNPTYDFTHKFHIERKKSFNLFCERKKVFLELFQYRFMLPDVQLGKAELKLNTLLTKSQMSTTLDVNIECE
jgi:hypothetical protein